MNVLSFSQLQAYWACPRLYYYRYHLQVPQPSVGEKSAQEGSWIHEQIQLDYLGENTELSHKPEWSQIWETYQQEITPYKQAASWSEWTCHVPVDLGSQRLWLMGRMDRIYLQNQTLTILDWKTGTVGPGQSTDLQLDFYIWLCWLAQGLLAEKAVERIRGRAVWLNLSDTVLEKEFRPKEIPTIARSFHDLLLPFQSEEQKALPEPRSVNGRLWCTMCEYQPLCPEGKYHA